MMLAFTQTILAAAAVVAFAGVSTSASAQVVEFAGSTAGCFFTPRPCSVQGFLTFSGTALNEIDLRHVHVRRVHDRGKHRGQVERTAARYDADSFRLLLTFTTPADGASEHVLTAALARGGNEKGNVVFIDLDNDNMFVGTQNESPVQVNGVSVNGGGILALSGNLLATTVPEPGSMTLLGTGLLGLAGLVRRRRRVVTQP